MKVEDFKKLDNYMKILYLSQILRPIIKTGKDRDTLEMFLYGSTDEELVNFYDAVLNPEKTPGYIENQKEKMKKSVNELKQINQLFSKAKIEMMESLEKEDVDNVVVNI